MQITKHRERIENVAYSRSFEWRDMPGAGFGFDCDALGNVATLHPAGAANLAKCLDGTYDVIDRGIERREWSYVAPAEGKCQCGRLVILDGDTRGEGIDCECGRIYNSAGQELAARRFWGEETGESF